jgi:hypothetical protein
MMSIDPAIDEIRRVRHEISREVDHDPHRLKATFSELESQFERPAIDYGGRRAIRSTGATKAGESAAEDRTSPQ